jgi:very-short-patch-repair endonuclease
MDADLLHAAEGWHGVTTRELSRLAGVSRHTVDRELASGLLVAEHPGIFRVAGAPITFEQSALIACLAGGKDAVASHSAAAHLWRLATIAPKVEITIPSARRRTIRGVVVHRSTVTLRDRTTFGVIPVTDPVRTCVDYAGVAPRWECENALEEGLTQRLFTCVYLGRRLEALGRRGRKGAGVLASLLAERPEEWVRAESRLERRILRALRDHGIRPPVLQYAIPLRSGRTARVDMAYPPERLIVEGNSYKFHVRRRDWARNDTRNRELEALGYGIIPITWEDLDERVEATMEIVRVALDIRRDLWKLRPRTAG